MPTPLLPRPDGLIFPSLGPCPTIPPPFGHEWVCAFAAQRTDLSAPIYALEYRCLNLDASDSALSDTARSDSLRANRAVFFLTGCLGGLLLAGGAWLYVNLTAHTQPAPPAGPISSANAPLATSADMARCYASAIADEPAPPHVFPWEPLPAGTGASTAKPVAGGAVRRLKPRLAITVTGPCRPRTASIPTLSDDSMPGGRLGTKVRAWPMHGLTASRTALASLRALP